MSYELWNWKVEIKTVEKKQWKKQCGYALLNEIT